jgi:hypothetical protein
MWHGPRELVATVQNVTSENYWFSAAIGSCKLWSIQVRKDDIHVYPADRNPVMGVSTSDPAPPFARTVVD